MFDKNLDNFLNDKITDFSEIGRDIGKKDVTKGKNLDNLAGIAIGVSDPAKIRELSYGKVLISETINYRTQRPERGGLFCEQIFGPRKNYECACGKYKRIRYKGVVCERCGVEVTKTSVRRERMGHIDLYAPVAHIWFLKSVPSRIGLLLDISVKKLEQVIYFASYIVTDVYEDKLAEAIKDLEERYKVSKIEMQKNAQKTLNEIKLEKEAGTINKKEAVSRETMLAKKMDDFTTEFEELKEKVKMLKIGEVIGEMDYRVLSDSFAHIFEAGTGAENLKVLLSRINLEEFITQQQRELQKATLLKQKKILQKIKLATNLAKSNQRPERFILESLPIIPPDLRPMIQLDGGRFASSDLNNLYRRVINRNNRLKKLIELGAPDVILKNEKRMLQESVDTLIIGKARTNRSGFVSANKKKLKSLTDILKGKQGRFRQNLLGKRVDYSGRSVIVVGPELKMDEFGLPKKMALTLFKPFVIGKLIQNEIVYNIKHAEKYIEEGGKEVWDALDEVIEGKYVLMNRAPTLHRLSIQAFRPVLIEGKAIQLHPLSCAAFNADFDGDQMAVHLPITDLGQQEARELMVPSKNLLSPSSGEPIISPSQDMILGCYYLTAIDKGAKGAGQIFASIIDAEQAYQAEGLGLRAPIKTRLNGKIEDTTYGRLIFNQIVPEGLGFINEILKGSVLKAILADCFERFGSEITAAFSNDIKDLGYKYATVSGLSISKDDMNVPDNKYELIKDAEDKIKYIQKKYWHGFMNEEGKYRQSIAVWAEVKNIIQDEMKKFFDEKNHIFNLVDSGARGNWGQITQLCGMKGLVASPSGRTIELPIKSNLKEGFSTLEYFIATHGGRKGKSDTALKTAQSGYLTRRLVDAAQNMVIKELDCGTIHYEEINREDSKNIFNSSFEKLIFGRTLAEDVLDKKGNIVIKANIIIDNDIIELINSKKIDGIKARTVLGCETEGGVCERCYGLDLGLNKPVEVGAAVGVIAAQSIGEPGTQLTMRTFHSGGVAKEGGDITQGLARVEELFEARNPKYSAEISQLDGKIEIINNGETSTIRIVSNELEEEEYYFGDNYNPIVKEGQEVKVKQVLAKGTISKTKIVANHSGIIKKIESNRIVTSDTEHRVKEYEVDASTRILFKDGESILKGDKLTEGHINLSNLKEIAGELVTEKYIVNEIKSIYASQGQTVNSKHIELIVRQMFSKVRVTSKGDTEFFPGDIVDIIRFNKVNNSLIKEGRLPAIGERLLMGITKISIHTDSWLSSASFQETVRCLVESSVSGKTDNLEGLKENVIIGRLIPAGKHYRELHGLEKVDENQLEEGYFDSSDDIKDNTEDVIEG